MFAGMSIVGLLIGSIAYILSKIKKCTNQTDAVRNWSQALVLIKEAKESFADLKFPANTEKFETLATLAFAEAESGEKEVAGWSLIEACHDLKDDTAFEIRRNLIRDIVDYENKLKYRPEK